MLKDGSMKKLSNYIVYFYDKDDPDTTYVLARSAQDAANQVREGDRNIRIVEVAKVVKNWK